LASTRPSACPLARQLGIALDAIEHGDDDRLADRLADLDAEEEPHAVGKALS
jgi:hypothetical protein